MEMPVQISGLLGHIPLDGVVTIGIGLFLMWAGGWSLSLEIRSILAGEPSPATFEEEPEALDVSRRALDWIGGIVLILLGLGFAAMGYAVVHSCVIGNAAASAC